jgi:hypothetical protein
MDANRLASRDGLNSRPDSRPVPLATPPPSGVPMQRAGYLDQVGLPPERTGPSAALRGGHQTRPGFETAPNIPAGVSLTAQRANAAHEGLPAVAHQAPSAALKAATTSDAVGLADALAGQAGLGAPPGGTR